MLMSNKVKVAFDSGAVSWTDLLNQADEVADAYEQDFENEMTYFRYDDGSVAVFCGVDQSINIHEQDGSV